MGPFFVTDAPEAVINKPIMDIFVFCSVLHQAGVSAEAKAGSLGCKALTFLGESVINCKVVLPKVVPICLFPPTFKEVKLEGR